MFVGGASNGPEAIAGGPSLQTDSQGAINCGSRPNISNSRCVFYSFFLISNLFDTFLVWEVAHVVFIS